MALEVFIKQLGQELDMQDLIKESEPGHYQLPFEDNMDVDVFLSPQGHYYFKSKILDIPGANNLEPLFIKVMDANLFGRGTRGAVIGLNEDGNLLTLSQEVDFNSTYKDWRDKLQDFVTILNFWRNEALNLQ